jgi:hypothetical protein
VGRAELNLAGPAGEVTWRRLFNGHSLDGWSVHLNGKGPADPPVGWEVRDGVLHCTGGADGDLRTNERFDNYVLVVRFRCPEPAADSGIGVMLTADGEDPALPDGGRYLEVQLLPERSGDLYVINQFAAEAGGARIAFSHRRHTEVDDLVGRLHEARLVVADGSVTVFINGTEVNRTTGCTVDPGRILLRNEGRPLEFHELSLLSLGEE